MQGCLFTETELRPLPRVRKTHNGGSGNPIVFRDYDSFISKFADNPKTTDECWTPQDIYEAVLQYVSEIHDMSGKVVLRPFYPGGDYEKAEYPDNGVVIDNPPFSIFTKICRFYVAEGIPFFLFGPGMTIGSIFGCCTAVIVSDQITFTNGASVRCNFATNLLGDTICTTSVRLSQLLKSCQSQNVKASLTRYDLPAEVVSVSDFQTIARGDEDFSLSRSEAVRLKNLSNHPKGGLFGDHLLVSTVAAAKVAAAKTKVAAADTITIPLATKERRIVEQLDAKTYLCEKSI